MRSEHLVLLALMGRVWLGRRSGREEKGGGRGGVGMEERGIREVESSGWKVGMMPLSRWG